MADIVEDVKQITPSPEGPVYTHTRDELHYDLGRLVRAVLLCVGVLLLFALILIGVVVFVVLRLTQNSSSTSVPSVEQIYTFWAVFAVMTLLVFGVALAIVVGLIWPKTFSLSDALSSPSPVQPKIEKPEDVLILGSTSRLIAFVGLLGILCLALGVGYSIVYDIIIRDHPPQLTQVSWFLGAMASLFAPYLANQVKEAVVHSKTPAPTDPNA
jgi:hypothetical protein